VRSSIAALVWCCIVSGPVWTQGEIVLYDDAEDFFAAVGPTTRADWSEVYAAHGYSVSWIDRDPWHFRHGEREEDLPPNLKRVNRLYRDDYTDLLPGNEITASGPDGMDIWLAPEAYSLGFWFAEPTTGATGPDASSPFIDSVFEVSLNRHEPSNQPPIEFTESFNFNVENDSAAFVGIWSDTPIKMLAVKELVDDPSDEFFGDWYAGSTPYVSTIPEPSTLTIWSMLGLVGFGAWRRQKTNSRQRPTTGTACINHVWRQIHE
jgi:hypothetical protein